MTVVVGGAPVYDSFEHFQKTKECNNVGWLLIKWLLMLLDKVMIEKDEFRDANSQFHHCVNDLRASIGT